MDYEAMKTRLIDRMSKNLNDYQAELLQKDRQALIDGASDIAHVQDTYEDITGNHEFSDGELRHFLQFENPLEVIATHWPDSTLVSTADLNHYPLATDTKPKEPLRKFLNVDVIASLRSILGQVNVHYRTDFDADKQVIQKAVRSEEPEKRNLVWLCRESGTHLHKERDVFIKDTASFNNIQFYHKDCQSEKAVLYSVEITGVKNGVVRGNLYERDRHQYAELAGRTASPFTNVTLTFNSGEELRIPQEDFKYSNQSDLEYEHGKIMEVRNEAEDESVVQGALQREHERRDNLPKGTISAHVQKLADQRVQAEADRITSTFENLTEPNSPSKTHKMVKLSDNFMFLASSRDTDQLLDKLHDHLKNDTLHMSGLKGEKGVYCFIKEQKPSIKEQLAAPPIPGNQPVTKAKDRDAR